MQIARWPGLSARLAATFIMGFAATVAAAAYPERPITLIMPFPAGGTVDAVARIAADRLGQLLQTTVIVEPAPGAGGTIATQRVARAEPDGYTLLFTTPNHTINPAIRQNLSFDTRQDFAPISLVAQIPELLVANSSQPFDTFAGFVDYARKNPGKLNYASAGNGTLPHVTMELLLQELKLDVVHIPYKGAAPAMKDLLGGQVGLKMDTITTSTPHIESGRLKPLALADAQRSPLMPDVPTIDESGVPGYAGILWMGILAPSGTDADVIQKLQRAIADTVATPDVRTRFDATGVQPIANSPAEFAAMIDGEIEQWKGVVKAANIMVD